MSRTVGLKFPKASSKKEPPKETPKNDKDTTNDHGTNQQVTKPDDK